MNHQRKIILNLIAEKGEVKKSECTAACKHFYVANAQKYVGEILSRMVKNGTLERVKRGVYRAKTNYINSDCQIGLFANQTQP